MSGVGFLYSGGLWFLFIVEVLLKVSWLGKVVLLFWCMEHDFFSLECNGVPSNELSDGSMC